MLWDIFQLCARFVFRRYKEYSPTLPHVLDCVVLVGRECQIALHCMMIIMLKCLLSYTSNYKFDVIQQARCRRPSVITNHSCFEHTQFTSPFHRSIDVKKHIPSRFLRRELKTLNVIQLL